VDTDHSVENGSRSVGMIQLIILQWPLFRLAWWHAASANCSRIECYNHSHFKWIWL